MSRARLGVFQTAVDRRASVLVSSTHFSYVPCHQVLLFCFFFGVVLLITTA